MNNAFLERLWKIWEYIVTLNLSQQKEKETIWWQNQLSYYKVFHRISVSNRNEKKHR